MNHTAQIVSASADIRVPLSNRPGQYATLCPEGYAIAQRLGVGALYIALDGSRKHGYVTWTDMTAPGEAATLARALTGAGKGQRVRYRDRDTTNLRLDNLYIERGAAKAASPRVPEAPGSDL